LITHDVKRGLIGAAMGLALARLAAAQLDPNLTPPEFKCEASVNKADGKYLRSLAKCTLECQRGFTKSLNPVYDCYAPYGGAMAACHGDPIKGADAKFRLAIAKRCDPATNPKANCPECYDAAAGATGCGVTGYGNDHQQQFLNFFDTIVPSVFCKTNGASIAEQKCQENTMKGAAKHVASIYKCWGKCFQRAHDGSIPGADCKPNPVLPDDVTTQNCIATVESKTILAFDKRCTAAGVNIQCPIACSVNAGCDSARWPATASARTTIALPATRPPPRTRRARNGRPC
jgi:hypothetical protein